MQQSADINLLEPVNPAREFKSVGKDQETTEKPEDFLDLLAGQLSETEDKDSQAIEIKEENSHVGFSLEIDSAVISGSVQAEEIALSQHMPGLPMLSSKDKNPLSTDLSPPLASEIALQELPQSGENLPSGQSKTTLELQLPASPSTPTNVKAENLESQHAAINMNTLQPVKTILQSEHPLAAPEAKAVQTAQAIQVAPAIRAIQAGETVDAELILEEISESELFPKSELLDLGKTRTSKSMPAALLARMAQVDLSGTTARSPASVITTSPTAELNLAATTDTASTTGKLTDVLGQAINPQQGKWDQAVGNRLMWMINKNMNSASIRLDPPSLGKLDIKISISEGEAIINIQTEHAAVRDAIDQAASKLKEMIQNQGFNQVNVAVNQEEKSMQRDAFSASDADSNNQDEDDVSPETNGLPQGIDVSLNWVNFYA